MRILFLHGWHSTPGGMKPTYLRDHGHEVLNPALPDVDFDAAVRIAQAEFDQHRPDVVVGSSFRRDSALLNATQYLPVGDEERHDAPHPRRYSWLERDKKDLSAVGAVVEALRLPVLPQQFTTMRAGAYHGLIS